MKRVRTFILNRLLQLASVATVAMLISGQASASSFNPKEASCNLADPSSNAFCIFKNGHYYSATCVKYRMGPVAGLSTTDWWFRTYGGGCTGSYCSYIMIPEYVEAVDSVTRLDGYHPCFKTDAEAIGDDTTVVPPDQNTNIVSVGTVPGKLPFAATLDRYCEPYAGTFNLEINGSWTPTSVSTTQRCYERAGTFKVDMAKLGSRSYSPARTTTDGVFSLTDHLLSPKHPVMAAVYNGNPPLDGETVVIDDLPVRLASYVSNSSFGAMKDDGNGFSHSLNGWGGGLRVVALTVSAPGRLRVWGSYIYGDQSIWTPSAVDAWQQATGFDYSPTAYPSPVQAYPILEEYSGADVIEVQAGDTVYLWGQYYSSDSRHGFYVTLSDSMDNEIASHFVKQRQMPVAWQLGFDNSN